MNAYTAKQLRAMRHRCMNYVTVAVIVSDHHGEWAASFQDEEWLETWSIIGVVDLKRRRRVLLVMDGEAVADFIGETSIDVIGVFPLERLS